MTLLLAPFVVLQELKSSIIILKRPDKKQVVFLKDPSVAVDMPEEIVKLWRSVSVEGMDAKKIADHLDKSGFSFIKNDLKPPVGLDVQTGPHQNHRHLLQPLKSPLCLPLNYNGLLILSRWPKNVAESVAPGLVANSFPSTTTTSRNSSRTTLKWPNDTVGGIEPLRWSFACPVFLQVERNL